jgi:polysaccharide transporter, PST family
MFVLNAFLLAILNGKKEIKRYVCVAISGSFVSMAVTGLLAIYWGIYGVMLALVVNQSVMVVVTIAICRRAGWFRLRYLFGRIELKVIRDLGKYTAMALTTAGAGPFSQILVRKHLAHSLGWEAAGRWQAVTKVSELYLLLVTSTLSLYYLPRLSEIKWGARVATRDRKRISIYLARGGLRRSNDFPAQGLDHRYAVCA